MVSIIPNLLPFVLDEDRITFCLSASDYNTFILYIPVPKTNKIIKMAEDKKRSKTSVSMTPAKCVAEFSGDKFCTLQF